MEANYSSRSKQTPLVVLVCCCVVFGVAAVLELAMSTVAALLIGTAVGMMV